MFRSDQITEVSDRPSRSNSIPLRAAMIPCLARKLCEKETSFVAPEPLSQAVLYKRRNEALADESASAFTT
jgi:hypothetical protein